MLRLAFTLALAALTLGCARPAAPVRSDLETEAEAVALAREALIQHLGSESDNWEFHVIHVRRYAEDKWKASGYLQGSPHGVRSWEAEYQLEGGSLQLRVIALDSQLIN